MKFDDGETSEIIKFVRKFNLITKYTINTD